MKKQLVLSITGILLLILIVSGSTFAYFSTVVKGNGNDISANSKIFNVDYHNGQDINGELDIVTDKANGRVTEVEIGLTENIPGVVGNILLNVENITDNLKINGFKWESYLKEGNTETLQKSGNFSAASNDLVISLVDNYPLTTSMKTFKIYIWLDANDPSTDQNVADGTANFRGYISATTNRLTGILDRYTVTFDYNGATGGNTVASKQVTYGQSYGTLPTPTKEGYTFLGWHGRNYYNANDTVNVSSGVTKDGNDWITINTSSGARYYNYFTHNLNIIENTTYTFAVEFGNVSNITNYLTLTSGDSFRTQFNFKNISEIDSNSIQIFDMISRGDATLDVGLRTYYGNPNLNTNELLTFRISVLDEDNTITSDNFKYEPYYITSDTTVVQQQNHTLKAIWEENS